MQMLLFVLVNFFIGGLLYCISCAVDRLIEARNVTERAYWLLVTGIGICVLIYALCYMFSIAV